LPSLSKGADIGKVSGSGFAFGYIGGLTCLAIVLLFFVAQGNGKTIAQLDPVFGLDPSTKEGTRFVGPLVALWFILFMIPYFLWVREPRRDHRRTSIGAALAQVIASIKGLTQKRSLGSYLLSSMFYRDALNGLYTFGGTYAILVLNWEATLVGVFGIISGLGAAGFSFVGGRADKRFGPKPVIICAIWVLIAVSVVVINITPTSAFGIQLADGSVIPTLIFFICGVFIGGMGGTLQAASRSLMVRHCTPDTSTEYFGLYGLSGRATAFLAPLLIGIATTVSQSAQIGVSPVILLFLLGLFFLRWVKPDGEV